MLVIYESLAQAYLPAMAEATISLFQRRLRVSIPSLDFPLIKRVKYLRLFMVMRYTRRRISEKFVDFVGCFY